MSLERIHQTPLYWSMEVMPIKLNRLFKPTRKIETFLKSEPNKGIETFVKSEPHQLIETRRASEPRQAIETGLESEP